MKEVITNEKKNVFEEGSWKQEKDKSEDADEAEEEKIGLMFS